MAEIPIERKAGRNRLPLLLLGLLLVALLAYWFLRPAPVGTAAGADSTRAVATDTALRAPPAAGAAGAAAASAADSQALRPAGVPGGNAAGTGAADTNGGANGGAKGGTAAGTSTGSGQ